jgi:putative membrane protein
MIERRLMLLGAVTMAASTIAASAVAQTNPATSAAPSSPDDYMKRTMSVGALSLAISRIASPKVKSAMLKQFVAFEIAEQETVGDILKAMMSPNAKPSGMVASPSDADVMSALDDTQKAMVQKLNAMKGGVEFDRSYIKAEVEGHQQLLAIQEAYLKIADNLDKTNVAKLAKGMIIEHLTLLGDLEKQIG